MLSARSKLVAALLAVVALAALRLVHLEADTPLTAGTGSMGLYVDEGYKTLDARNLSLFGSLGWHPDDEFAGVWMKRSFVTQAVHYLAFRLAGAELATARIVSVLFFLVFLLGYLHAALREFSTGLFFAGLVLLGLMHTLFFFSRVALIELAVITSVYWFLFLLRRWTKPTPPTQIAAAAAATLFTTLAVQPTAAFCLFPLLGGVVLSLWVRGEGGGRWSLFAILAFGLAATFTALWSADVLLERMPRRAPTELRELLLNPLTASSALLVAAGLLCLCHILLTQPRRFFVDPYRLSLALLITLGPLSVAILPYDPLRYYVPFLPAYLLLTLEWLHLRLWEAPMPRSGPRLPAALGAILLLWPIACLARTIKLHLLGGRSFEHGLLLSYWDKPLYGEAIVLLAVAGLWAFRRTVLTGKPILWALCALIVVTGLGDLRRVGGFLASPTYQWRQISTAMAEIISPKASVAGDWAPLFTLGTPTRTLVMSSDFNYPSAERFLRFRPDYFLFSDTEGGRQGLESLLAEPRIEVAGPIYESEYAGRKVALYRLRYAASSTPVSVAGLAGRAPQHHRPHCRPLPHPEPPATHARTLCRRRASAAGSRFCLESAPIQAPGAPPSSGPPGSHRARSRRGRPASDPGRRWQSDGTTSPRPRWAAGGRPNHRAAGRGGHTGTAGNSRSAAPVGSRRGLPRVLAVCSAGSRPGHEDWRAARGGPPQTAAGGAAWGWTRVSA